MNASTTNAAINCAHWGAFRAEVSNGRLTGVRPLEGDTAPSPLLATIPDSVHHHLRIDRPMVRTGFRASRDPAGRDPAKRGLEPFVSVSWDEALDLVAGELARVRAAHGNRAIYGGSGWGSPGCLHNAKALMARFLNGFGGYAEPVTNYSFGAASVIVPRIVGSMQPVIGPVTSWPVIARHTRLFVCFGGLPPKNAQVNQGGLADHDLPSILQGMSAAGVAFVCFGPQRDDIAASLGAEWTGIRPGTDTAVMLGLAHTLQVENLVDRGFLARATVGFERFEPYLTGAADGQPKDAAWAASIAGIDPMIIRRLARRMAAERTMLSVSWSVQRADHGEQPYWMAITLAAMLGQIGLPGGGFGFGYGAINGIGKPRLNVPLPRLPTLTNPAACTVPVARLTDMLLHPGDAYEFNGKRCLYPDIRLIYWCGGNAFHQQQDINRLLRAWRRPETIIVHEPWWTPAARRADIVLPVTTTLERDDICASAFDDSWIAMHQVIPPVGEARDDYAIFADLAGRLDFGERFSEGRDAAASLRHIYDVARQATPALPEFETFWSASSIRLPASEPTNLFAAFRDDPVANPLKTPSGGIEIYSATIAGFGYDDCPGHASWLEPAEWLGGLAAARWPLHLISNQPRSRLHSQMDIGPVSQAAKVRGREALRMNPSDAAARRLAEGDVVRVFNDRGACLAGVVLSDAVMPGVVSLSTGAWFDPLDAEQPGSLDVHGNPNVLTRDKGSSRLGQCCTAQTTLVEVEFYDGEVPEITVFRRPEIRESSNEDFYANPVGPSAPP